MAIDCVFSDQTDAILYIVFDPLDEFVYASSQDKSYAIYSIKQLRCVKKIENRYDISNVTYINSLHIFNICPHKHGLVTCYLSRNSIHVYERYIYTDKFCLNVFKSTIPDVALTGCKFLLEGHLIVTIDSASCLFIFDFIKFELMRKYEFCSTIPLQTLHFYNEDLIFYLNTNFKLKKIDLNKF